MQDELDLLPSAPEGVDAKSETSLKKHAASEPDVSIDELKNLISEKLFFELAETNAEKDVKAVASECLLRAKTTAQSVFKAAGILFTLWSKTQRLAVLYFAVYHLYLYNGDSEGAAKWLSMANDLIAARYDAKRKAELKAVAASIAK